jgi:hypothetical protein
MLKVLSECAMSRANAHQGHKNNFQIQRNAPRADVLQVEVYGLAPIQQPAAVYLREAGDPGPVGESPASTDQKFGSSTTESLRRTRPKSCAGDPYLRHPS